MIEKGYRAYEVPESELDRLQDLWREWAAIDPNDTTWS